MDILKSNNLREFYKFILKNSVVFVVVLMSTLLISISYIGLAYALKKPLMLSYAIKDYRLPFNSYGKKLYAKLYWDATLSLPKDTDGSYSICAISEDSLRDAFNYDILFNTFNLEIHKYAADKGNMNAQFYIGNQIYLHPINVEHSERGGINDSLVAKEKIMWLSKAAAQGHVEALDSLGVLFARGASSLSPDTLQAIKYFSKAAECGDVFALTKKGLLLIALNDTTGLDCLVKADSEGYIPATIELGKFYYPWGTPQNPYANKDKSKFYFSKAINNDNTGFANYYLGWLTGGKDLYYHTPEESMEYFLRGARQGYNPSRYMLGYLTVENGKKNRGTYWLETPPSQYSIEKFDQLRRKSKYANRGTSDSKSDYYFDSYYNTPGYRKIYSIYCGWAWIIIAAEDGYDEAIKYIEKHRDNKVLHKVLSCRDSNVESVIDGNMTTSNKSLDEQNEGN